MSWTPEHSSLLSLLLDEVVGTQEMIDIRQDFCRLWDCRASDIYAINWYFTGSKAEGLDLPGSDEDYMFDVNTDFKIKVVQTLQEIDETNTRNKFLLCTDNVPPGFALLQSMDLTPCNPNCYIFHCLQNINGMHLTYLSSDLFAQYNTDHKSIMEEPGDTQKRQGPSIEIWGAYEDKSESGTDYVPSIHCPFWPNSASEWTQRPRHFGWPSSRDISSIIDFGCHLVPVGHPHSDTKLTEWRISFSLAERTLVWSFNHIQMQCYAVMKIILKQFIKIKCSSKNFVLCSYFIKTFLFWKYETTDLNLWCSENFRCCIKFLLIEFSKCIQEGILSHYFIPRFNLLSVKLTREAQAELKQIMDMAIRCEMCTLKQCKTLQGVWSKFLSATENRSSVVRNRDRDNLLITDACFNAKVLELMSTPYHTQLLSVVSKTHLKICFIKKSLQMLHIRLLLISACPGNKELYQLHKFTNNDALSTDISTGKLWYAFYLLMRKDYTSTLSTVNQLLSNIAPFALYSCPCDNSDHWGSTEAKEFYVDRFMDSEMTVETRLNTAWLMPFMVDKDMAHVMPLAIQIELLFNDHDHNRFMLLSPYVCAYYLMFLCYHELRQYDQRDRALQLLQLIDVFNNAWQPGPLPYQSCNIIGHCLYLAGDTTQAQEFFIRSYQFTQDIPPYDKYNSALYYLQCLF